MKKTRQEFFQEHIGQKVEVAGSVNAQNQCVDAVNAYLRDVWEMPIIEHTNAVDFPSRIGSEYEFIANTAESFPRGGDVIVFKKYGTIYGIEGHIGIVVASNLKTIAIFEQNFPTGSVCKVGMHNYLGCVGWFRPKNALAEDTMYTQAQWQAERDERDKNWNMYQEELQKNEELAGEAKIVREQLQGERDKNRKDIEKIAVILNVPPDFSKILPAIETCVTFEEKARNLEKKLKEEREEYEAKITGLSKTLEKLGNDFEIAKKRLDDAEEELRLLKEEKPENPVSLPKENLFVMVVRSVVQFVLQKIQRKL